MNWLELIGYEHTHTPTAIFVVRLLIAAVLGGVIGFEREVHHRAAGLRTHILIATAATLFTLLGQEIFFAMRDGPDVARVDLVRVIEAVTTGVAFLGAGAIFRSGSGVRGLTTGAGMWLAGAVGIAVGFGHYVAGLAAALLALVVLQVLRPVSRRVSGAATRNNEHSE